MLKSLFSDKKTKAQRVKAQKLLASNHAKNLQIVVKSFLNILKNAFKTSYIMTNVFKIDELNMQVIEFLFAQKLIERFEVLEAEKLIRVYFNEFKQVEGIPLIRSFSSFNTTRKISRRRLLSYQINETALILCDERGELHSIESALACGEPVFGIACLELSVHVPEDAIPGTFIDVETGEQIPIAQWVLSKANLDSAKRGPREEFLFRRMMNRYFSS